jgi:hypothetical protein
MPTNPKDEQKVKKITFTNKDKLTCLHRGKVILHYYHLHDESSVEFLGLLLRSTETRNRSRATAATEELE